MLELYHYNLSTCSQKVRLCLAEKGVEWQGHFVDLMKYENTSPEYLKINPNGLVPTLLHDGRAIFESTVINEYLDDAFPEPALKPRGAYERAQMRLWVKLEDETGLPAIFSLTAQKLIKPATAQRSADEVAEMVKNHPNRDRAQVHEVVAKGGDLPAERLQEAEAQLEKLLSKMEATLSQHLWLAGDTYSLADLAWLPFLDRMLILGLGKFWQNGRRPSVENWLARCKERPSYKEAILRFFPGRG